MSGADRVIVFDTTLRDGEQSPGATMTSAEKLEIAKAISRLGVDVIEAGFPSASPDDWRAVRAIAETVGAAPVPGRPQAEPPVICGLARATERDIELAWTAVEAAQRPRIHTFLATSPIHREHKLRMSKEQVIAKIRTMVAFARARSPDVEFSCEDAGRTEPDFLIEAVTAAIEAGATTINIPDTVGYTTPDEFGGIIAELKARVPNIDSIVISVHCHNDLGLATANTLAGVRAGARQVEVTVNGIGERAGNTALEEVIMALEVRRDRFGPRTGIDTTQIARVSRMVASVTGMNVQAHKAVVGANAFAHEAGIHQDGMLKHASTYEIMRPETVGFTQSRLVLGKHSGRHAFSARLVELGYPIEGEALDRAFAAFKELADKKKYLTDADLEAIVTSEVTEREPLFVLDGLQVACGSMGMPTATVRLKAPDGTLHLHAAIGTGPVDAAFRAIDAIIASQTGHADNTLLEYQVLGVTEGIDAIGEVSVRIQSAEASPRVHAQGTEGKAALFHGNGADTDIIVASAKAYLTAINRLLHATLPASGYVPKKAAAEEVVS